MKKELRKQLFHCYFKLLILHLTNEQIFGYEKNEDKISNMRFEIKEIKRKLKSI